MLASVSIRGKTAKIPYEPQTPLFVIRNEAARALTPLGTDYSKYRLRHGKLELDHTLPARLALRIRNPNLDLGIPASQPASVRVKVRGGSSNADWQGELTAEATIADVIAASNAQRSALTLYDYSLEPSLQLKEFGSSSIAFSRAATSHSNANGSNQGTAASAPAQAPVAAAPPAATAPGFGERKIQVHLGSNERNLLSRDEDPPLEPSQAQLRTYYNQLQQMGSKKPMISSDTREKLLQAKREPVSSIAIRVRLPDNTHIEAQFTRADQGSHVYDFVRSMLREPSLKFQLELASPHYVLKDEDNLISDLKWTSSVLLRMRYINKNESPSHPLLNDKALAMAPQGPSSAEKKPTSKEEVTRTPEAPQQPEPKPKKKFHRPKWLRLGK